MDHVTAIDAIKGTKKPENIALLRSFLPYNQDDFSVKKESSRQFLGGAKRFPGIFFLPKSVSFFGRIKFFGVPQTFDCGGIREKSYFICGLL